MFASKFMLSSSMKSVSNSFTSLWSSSMYFLNISNFKWFAVSATMSQRKIHLTRMNSQNPVDIFSDNSRLYSQQCYLPAQILWHIATLAWPTGTNKAIKLPMCTGLDKHVDCWFEQIVILTWNCDWGRSTHHITFHVKPLLLLEFLVSHHFAVTSISRCCGQKSYTVNWQQSEKRGRELKWKWEFCICRNLPSNSFLCMSSWDFISVLEKESADLKVLVFQ